MRKSFSLLVAAATLLPTSSVIAACMTYGASERLANYCFVRSIDSKAASFRTLAQIDKRLKREGYSQGLGLPNAPALPRWEYSGAINPIITYSDDINGGNPDKPLIIGSATFVGDEELARKSGIVFGAGGNLSGRLRLGEGRFVDASAGGAFLFSPQHELAIRNSRLSLTSSNHLENWWYLDIGTSVQHTKKDLTSDRVRLTSVRVSKIFSESPDLHLQPSAALQHYADEDYQHLRAVLGLEAISEEGWGVSFGLKIGEPVDGQLALRQGISASATLPIKGHPVRFSLAVTRSEGGLFLGQRRDETEASISATTPLSQKLSLTIGYKNMNSSFDYFDSNGPIASLSYGAIRF